MKKILNGEVFLVLFLLAGYYKASLEGIIPFDLTLAFLTLSILSALARIFKKQEIGSEAFAPMAIFMGISFLMLFSLLFIRDSYSLDKTMRFIIITGWSFFGPFLLTSRSDPQKSLKRYLGTFIFVGLLMISSVLFSQVPNQSGFVSAMGSNYLALGKMSSITALIGITYLMYFKPKWKSRLIIMFISTLGIYTLFISGGRMPVISFAICLPILFILGINIKGFKFEDVRIKKKTLVFGLSGILFIPLALNYLQNIGSTFLNRFRILFEGGGSSAMARVDHFQAAWTMVEESSLLGMGIGSYHSFTGGLGDRGYPHNIFLEFFSELGIVGLTLFIVLIGIALTRYFKFFYIKNEFFSVILLLLFTYSLLNALVSGDFNDNRMLFFFIALLCLSKMFIQGSNPKLEQTTN